MAELTKRQQAEIAYDAWSEGKSYRKGMFFVWLAAWAASKQGDTMSGVNLRYIAEKRERGTSVIRVDYIVLDAKLKTPVLQAHPRNGNGEGDPYTFAHKEHAEAFATALNLGELNKWD